MDRRIKKTKEAIKSAYKEFLTETNAPKITITELAKRANIDRKTFYLHYESIESIMQEIMQESLSELNHELDANGLSSDSSNLDVDVIIRSMNTCIEKNLDFYIAISHRLDFDVFVKEIKTLFVYHALSTLKTSSASRDQELQIYVQYIISGVIDVYADWFRRNSPMSLDELGIAITKILNEGIHVLKKETP